MAKIQRLKGPPPTAAQGFVAFGQQISNVAMAISSLKGLFDTWNNEDMTIGEKALSTLTTLGMIIPMVTMSWNKNTAAELAAFSASIRNNAAKLLVAAGLKGEAIAAAAASGGLASEAAASLMAATGTETFGAALWTLLWPIGLLMLALGALVGTIALVVKGFQWLESKSPAGQLRAAEEEAKALTDALNDAKTKANELKSTFDNYDSLVEKLNSCTRGTEEWNAALKEVNDATADILQKYPELLSMENLFNEDGVINQDIIDNMVEKADKAVQTANAAALMGQADVQVKKGEASKDYLTSQDNISLLGAGAFGGIGTVTVLNEIGDAIQGWKIDKVVENYSSMGEAALSSANIAKTLGIDLAHATDAQLEYVESVRETARELVDGATAMRNAAKATVDEWAQSQELELNEAESAMLANKYNDSYEDIKAEVIATENAANSQGSRNDQSGVWERYLAATGQDFELARNGIRGSDDNRTFAYLDNGEEKEVSLETMAAAIAAAEALEGLGASASEVSELLSGMSASGVEFAAGLANGLQEDGSIQLNDYLEGFSQEDLDTFKGKNKEEVLALLDMTEEEFSSLAEEYGMTTRQLLRTLSSESKEVAKSISKEEKDKLKNLDTSDMTVGEQKEFASNRTDMYNNFKDSGIKKPGINAIEKENKDNGKNLSEFYKELSNIDLESEDAAEKIAELKEEYNIQGKTVDQLITKVKNLNHTYSVGTGDINTEKKELDDIVGEEGLSNGDVIEQEDLDKLREAGVNVDQYFTQMADGTYKLTGNAEEFNRIVNQISLDKLIDQANDFSQNREETAKQYSLTDPNQITNTDYVPTGRNTKGQTQNLGKARTEYVQGFEDMDFSDIEGADEILNLDLEDKNLELTKEQLEVIDQMIDKVNSKEVNVQAQALMEAGSLEEMQAMAELFEGGVNSEAYNQALIGLASQYDNCTEEIKEFNEAILTGDAEQIAAAQSALELSTRIGEMSEEFNLDAEETESYAKRLAENLEIDAEAAADLAVANQRLDRGMANLNDNLDDYQKSLKPQASLSCRK